MRDIKNLNIWKQEPDLKGDHEAFLDADITELNLGVRSYNCLKRAGCNTIRDIFQCMDEDGQGLRKIRNLGTRSENEIMEKIKELEEIYEKTHPAGSAPVKRTIIKPAKKIWDMEIDQFHLSNHSLQKLSACGIKQIRDLYATNPKQEPGWYAVRELFEKIPGTK